MERQEVIYYRQQLKEYLRSTKYYRNADEQKVQKFVEAIENDLLEIIRTNQLSIYRTFMSSLTKKPLVN